MNTILKSSLATFATAALLALAACGEKSETIVVPAPAGGGVAAAPVKVTPSKDYPLKTCVVSGEPLGSMGDIQAYKVGDVEVQICCPMCLAKFNADPAKYAAMVTAATKK